MSKNSPGAAATAAKLDQLEGSQKVRSDAEVHAASSPIIGAAPYKTDSDVHLRRTPQTIMVKAGDVIVHYVGAGGRWFKGEESMQLTPDRNVMAVALSAFCYQEGVGELYHRVKFQVLRRFMKPRGDFSGGDIPILNAEARAKLSTALPQGLAPAVSGAA